MTVDLGTIIAVVLAIAAGAVLWYRAEAALYVVGLLLAAAGALAIAKIRVMGLALNLEQGPAATLIVGGFVIVGFGALIRMFRSER